MDQNIKVEVLMNSTDNHGDILSNDTIFNNVKIGSKKMEVMDHLILSPEAISIIEKFRSELPDPYKCANMELRMVLPEVSKGVLGYFNSPERPRINYEAVFRKALNNEDKLEWVYIGITI